MADAIGRPVALYVYDLSHGMARQFSLALIGTYIDAVYHTSVVVGGSEFYYGQGIQVSLPGQTHHGEPMEKVVMGTTALPDEIIIEYLESIKSIYLPEAYDLFMHNCNNFSNDFCMFLTGKNIPPHITSLPQTVLDTPFGQMLRPQIEQAMRPITTAPTVSSATSIFPPQAATSSPVRVARNLQQFDEIMSSANDRCLLVFFTSATCPPCRAIYPHFELKARELGEKAVFVKVDIGEAIDVGQRYTITATPTFISFSKGVQVETWKGANKADLDYNLKILVGITYPAHPHTNHNLPITFSTPMTAITYPKIPPFAKVREKLGSTATAPAVLSMINFLEERQRHGAREVALPDLSIWASFIRDSIKTVEKDGLFPIIDIFRATLVDPRISGWIIEEPGHDTIFALIHLLTDAGAQQIPYPLRLVTIQALCNLFSSPLAPLVLASPPFSSTLIQAITSSLLDNKHIATRVSTSSLAFNFATYIQKQRSTQGQEVLAEEELVELFVGILEAVKREEDDSGGLKALLVAGLLLVYCVPMGSEILEVIDALGAGEVLMEKGQSEVGKKLGVKGLCEEVGRLFSWKA